VLARSARRPWQIAVPYLALADVFICAISVVFILLLLSDPDRVLEQNPPQTDNILRCDAMGVSLLTGLGEPLAGPVPVTEVSTLLSALDLGAVLAVRILVQGPAARVACLEDVAAVLDEQNRTLSEHLVAGGEGAYLLYDLELTETGKAKRSGRQGGHQP
jgi:hypothetical protein